MSSLPYWPFLIPYQERILAEALAEEEKMRIKAEEEKKLKEEQMRLEEENKQREERRKAREGKTKD